MRRLTAVLLLAIIPSALAAQKQCKKGIPCGGTCIAADKVCHEASLTTPAPAATAALTKAEVKPAAAPTTGPWVASSKGKLYYKSECSAATQLAPANRVFYQSEADAKKAGLSHSPQKGC